MGFKNILEEISSVAGILDSKGWAEGNAGNISVNITKFAKSIPDIDKSFTPFKLNNKFKYISRNFILLTGAGKRMRNIAEDINNNSVVLYYKGDDKNFYLLKTSAFIKSKFIPEKNILPTSELLSHLAIHNYMAEQKRDDNIILHTHPLEIISLTQIKKFTNRNKINNLLKNMLSEARLVFPDGIGFVPYTMPGSREIADLTLKEIKKYKTVIWDKHGCITVGSDISEILDRIDILVKSIKVFFLCKSAGYTPVGIKKS